MKELNQITGMTKSRTTPYHPMGNPIPERFNRILLDMLGTLEPNKESDWKKYLPSLLIIAQGMKRQDIATSADVRTEA